MHRLLQLSGVIIDLVYQVEQVPIAGEEALVRGFQMSAGGGFNAMLAARRSDMNTTYGGRLGQGPLADMARNQLQSESIAVVPSIQTNIDQGCCTVLVDSCGERTFIAKEGAEGLVTPDHLAAIDPAQFDWVLISGYALVYEGSRVALGDWIDQLPKSCRVVFDPCPLVASIPNPILKKVMARSTWISCNAAEARYLSGIDDLSSATRTLANALPTSGGAVVRQGESGCMLTYNQSTVVSIPAFPVTAIDTNGAGDAHVGTFIASLARGKEPREACVVANAAAALSTTIEGPATTPWLGDVQAFISRLKSNNAI